VAFREASWRCVKWVERHRGRSLQRAAWHPAESAVGNAVVIERNPVRHQAQRAVTADCDDNRGDCMAVGKSGTVTNGTVGSVTRLLSTGKGARS
jgi:hypothetical protein